MSFTRYLPTAGLALLCALLASLIPAINVTNYVDLRRNGEVWEEGSMRLESSTTGVYATVAPRFPTADLTDDALLAELEALRRRFDVEASAGPFSRGAFDCVGPNDLPDVPAEWVRWGRPDGRFRISLARVDGGRLARTGSLRVRLDAAAARFDVVSVFRTRNSDSVGARMIETFGFLKRFALGFLALAAAVGAFVLRPRNRSPDPVVASTPTAEVDG